jgi:hypothetical protein
LEPRSSQRRASSRNTILRSGLAIAPAASMHSVARARQLLENIRGKLNTIEVQYRPGRFVPKEQGPVINRAI